MTGAGAQDGTSGVSSEKNFSLKKAAFTLAEVLITLAIIGVVSAITLPTVIERHQKKQTVTSLKKAYSILGQALELSEAEHGEIASWDLYGAGSFKKYILPYLNKNSYCENCDVDYDIKQMNGEKAGAHTSYFYSHLSNGYRNIIVYLSDGMIISSVNGTSENTKSDGNGGRIKYSTAIIPITVDINGKKSPNKYGKDIFMLEFNSKYGIREYGYGEGNWNRYGSYKNIQSGQAHSCNKDATYGYWCAAKIILDGWQIKDDYPW